MNPGGSSTRRPTPAPSASTGDASGAARGDWMQTFTGRCVHPLSMTPGDVDVVDIAHGLSLLCRFNGQCDRYYSVAEHCLLMSQQFTDLDLAAWALLHDATEAYVGDMIRPLKASMPAYRQVEDDVMLAIARRFDLPLRGERDASMPAPVKLADQRILLAERNALMANTQRRWDVDDLEPLPVEIVGYDPVTIEQMYLRRFDELRPGVIAAAA